MIPPKSIDPIFTRRGFFLVQIRKSNTALFIVEYATLLPNHLLRDNHTKNKTFQHYHL